MLIVGSPLETTMTSLGGTPQKFAAVFVPAVLVLLVAVPEPPLPEVVVVTLEPEGMGGPFVTAIKTDKVGGDDGALVCVSPFAGWFVDDELEPFVKTISPAYGPATPPLLKAARLK
jgi:hypothetical protein